MFYFLRLALAVTVVLFFLRVVALGDDAKTSVNPALAAADQLCRSGKFAEAETSYRSLIKSDPSLMPAQAGLVRSLLRQDKLDDALEAVTAALKSLGEMPDLLAARGDVQYRLAQIPEAESSYADAKALDRKNIHALLGLSRIYRSQSNFRQAYDELRRAHEIAPTDSEVELAWMDQLSRSERLEALQAYLSGPHPDDPEQTQWMTDSVEFLKQTSGKPAHACRLVSKADHIDMPLFAVRNKLNLPSGVGLISKINDQVTSLQLDTGAGGIMVNRKIGEKAKLTRISAAHFGGVGEKPAQTGYFALAERIEINQLAFQDCVVFVSDKNSLGSEDGVIGADVFASYLVDIDLPGMRLGLSQLPKRPEDTPAPASLYSTGESNMGRALNATPGESNPSAENADASSATSGGNSEIPKDRFVAPEMARWTEVFRVGHSLLVPTTVNESPSTLFVLDTGAFDNIVAVRAGQQAAKLKSSFGLDIAALGGDPKKVFHAKVTLRFGHLQQSNVDTVTLDLSKMSHQTGTEISGLLGFTMLEFVDLKIDYRDGLVNMAFDPKRVQHLLKK
jgi:tetratricopeptide (TPR) repeat protein